MASPDEIIAYYVAMHQAGRQDDAFHGLLDFGPVLVPDLIRTYESSVEPSFRAFVVGVISEIRSPETAGFLCDALRQNDPVIWKAALNGLVTLRAAEAMEHVLTATLDEPKRSWIIEAIEQAREA